MKSGFPGSAIAVAAALTLAVCGAVRCAPADSGGGQKLPPLGRVLIVGIDGATFDLIRPLVDAGRLPVLAKLMRDGSSAALQTLEPTVSPAIWTTVATGKLPRAHGILGFDGVPGQSMTTLPTTQMRRTRAFWNILSERERSVSVVSWWVTWPAEEVRGFIVSDRVPYTRMEAAIGDEGSRDHEVYPPEIATEVRALVRSPASITAEELGRFVELAAAEALRVGESEYEHGRILPELKYVVQADRSTVDIAVHLIGRRTTDVTAVALYGVDAMSHLAWHFMDPESFPDQRIDGESLELFGDLIPAYYEYVDALLGELVDAAGSETTVIVFSDHGFGPTGYLPWSGGHGRITPGAPIAPDGILVLSGPPIRPGAEIDAAHVLDLTPTLLYLQGLPIAADMPGRILVEALRRSVLAESGPRRVATYETAPREQISELILADPELDRPTLEKLRALGYIE